MALIDGARPASPVAPQGRSLRVVLDTNVLLSLWVFSDSRFLPFLGEARAGRWVPLTNDRCHAEFRRVLGYPLFSLDDARQDAIVAEYLLLAETVDGDRQPVPSLPLCKDPDDQKFLELARDGKADWLVTSDKALLKLGRRRRLQGLFRILRPEAALAEMGAG